MAIEKTINIDVDSKDAEKGFDKLADAIKQLNDTFSKFQKTTEDGFDDVKDGAEKASKGVKKIGTTLGNIAKGTGAIFLLSKAFEIFKGIAEKNQKVLDVFNTAFEVLSIAFNDFFNFIFDNAGGVVDTFKSIFNDPVQAIKDFGKSIYDGIIVRFNELVEVTGLIGKSFLKLIQGDFKGAFETIKEAGKETVDVFTGVDDSFDSTVEKVKEIGKSVVEYGKNTLQAAKENVNLANAAELAAVKNQGLIEKYDRQAESLRQIRDDESKSIEERIKANEDLAKVLDDQEKAMKDNAAILVAAAAAELSKNKESIELQKAYQEALNEQAAIEAQITGFRSEQQTNVNSLLREQKEIQKELALIGKSERDIQRAELLQQYEEQKEIIDRQVTDEVEKNNLLLEAKRVYDEQLLELNKQFNDEDLEEQKRKQEAEAEIRKQAVESALAEKEAKAEIQNAAIGVAEKGIALGKQLAGKNKAIQKALLIAENAAGIAKILVNTGVANAKAIAVSPVTGGMPFVAFNNISAALGIAGSIAATTKGLQALGGGSTGASSSTPTTKAQPQAPNFNIVGATETSQLAEAVGSQTQQPVQAYVVSNDVTTAQSLENNIVEGATL